MALMTKDKMREYGLTPMSDHMALTIEPSTGLRIYRRAQVRLHEAGFEPDDSVTDLDALWEHDLGGYAAWARDDKSWAWAHGHGAGEGRVLEARAVIAQEANDCYTFHRETDIPVTETPGAETASEVYETIYETSEDAVYNRLKDAVDAALAYQRAFEQGEAQALITEWDPDSGG